jgi:hypothetical protein
MMRKITSKYEENKRRKRNQLVVGLILVFVMVVSVLGFGFQGGDSEEDLGSANKIGYGDFEFVSQNGFWVLDDFVFRYVPHQVEDLGISIKPIANYQGKPLYISSEDDEAELEIYMNLRNVAQRIQPACTEKEECGGDFPRKTCDNNFIIIRESNISTILQDNNCVYIEGIKEDLTKLTDQFLFKAIGIR